MNTSMDNQLSSGIYSKIQMTNSKLLKINNISLNIYLDGFDVPEFLDTAKLIKTYGGTVSAPNNETLVLSAPGYSVGTDYLRFHVNWLHDTIGRNELQDIGKYILPSITDDDYEEFAAEKSIEDEKTMEEEDKTTEKADKSVNELPSSTEPPRLTSELKECTIHIRDIRDKPPKLDIMEFQEIPGISDSSTKKVNEVKLLNLKKRENGTSEKSSTLATIKKRNRPRKIGSKRKLYYSEEEDRKILQYLIEHSAISKTGDMKIWHDMKAAGIIPKRSHMSLRTRFMRALKRNVKKYIDDAEIVAEFDALDNEVN